MLLRSLLSLLLASWIVLALTSSARTSTGAEALLGSTIWVDVVDGSDAAGTGTETAPYKTITKGVTVANGLAPATVKVVGRTCDGNIVGYSENVGESFPIAIGSGVNVIGTNQRNLETYIYPHVWSTNSSGPPALFRFDDAGGSNVNSSLQSMGLFSGSIGIQVEAVNGHAVSPLIKKITISRSLTGIDVHAANGSTANPEIRTCSITDAIPSFNWIPGSQCQVTGPALTKMEYGIRFLAEEASSAEPPGAIDADIISLECGGLFDKAEDKYIALVEVVAKGLGSVQHNGLNFDNIAKVGDMVESCGS